MSIKNNIIDSLINEDMSSMLSANGVNKTPIRINNVIRESKDSRLVLIDDVPDKLMTKFNRDIQQLGEFMYSVHKDTICVVPLLKHSSSQYCIGSVFSMGDSSSCDALVRSLSTSTASGVFKGLTPLSYIVYDKKLHKFMYVKDAMHEYVDTVCVKAMGYVSRVLNSYRCDYSKVTCYCTYILKSVQYVPRLDIKCSVMTSSVKGGDLDSALGDILDTIDTKCVVKDSIIKSYSIGGEDLTIEFAMC
jgi:hypothetical protein